jgi:hypothetical protein
LKNFLGIVARIHGLSRLARLAVFGAFLSIAAVSVVTAQEPMHFGMDATAAGTAASKGMPLTYGSLWAGAWNQKWGWGGIETQLQTAKAHGLVPVIQWWYWGDDISPNCVEQGCQDRYQQVWKDKATWYRLSNELADLVARVMGPGSTAVVIVEPEFNKNGIETYEPFDGYLADHAQFFHARNQQVVITFGNWGQSEWTRFDRAVAAADYLGTQVLYSSVRESSTEYLSGAQRLIDGAVVLQSMFGKPCFVTDFAFSSYPAPTYEIYQNTVVQDIFGRLGELKAAGVRGMVWRMLSDDPNFDTSNYNGMAERYWGLLRADGSEKPSFASFLQGMLAEVSGASSLPPPPSAPTGVTAVAGSTQVSLTWSAANGATSYNVKRSTTSGGPYATVVSGVTATAYTDTGLINGTTYYFVISAVGAGESLNSAQVSATPAAPPTATSTISVWSPTQNATLSGLQSFKALLQGAALSSYKMYWSVDGGKQTLMANSQVGGPHKEAAVDVTGWNWRGAGPYTITFVVKDLKNRVTAQANVTIYVR